MSRPTIINMMRLLRSKHHMSYQTAGEVTVRFFIHMGWEIPGSMDFLVRRMKEKETSI